MEECGYTYTLLGTMTSRGRSKGSGLFEDQVTISLLVLLYKRNNLNILTSIEFLAF